MSTWWKICTYNYEIKPVEVVGETAKYVTLDASSESFFKRPQRCAKANEYFPTFSEARIFLLTRLNNKFESLNQEMGRNKQDYDKVFLMEEPK